MKRARGKKADRLPFAVFHNGTDPLTEFRIRTIPFAIASTVAGLGVLAMTVYLPGHPPYDKTRMLVLGAVASGATAGLLVVPWRRPFFSGHRLRLLMAFYLWGLFEIVFVSFAIGLTGGSSSQVYLLYLPVAVFLAGVSFPRGGRVVMSLLTLVAYAGTLAATGWHVTDSTAAIHFGILVLIAVATDLHATEISSELAWHERTNSELARRAAIWDLVAHVGSHLDVLDADEVLATAVRGVVELGFEAVNVDVFDATESSYSAAHPIGLPPDYLGVRHPGNAGAAGRVLRSQSTIVFRHSSSQPDALPSIASEGFETTIGAPIKVEGKVVAVLVCRTRVDLEPAPEAVAAIENLAAHAGRSLERSRQLENERRDTQRFRTILESSPDATLVIDQQGLIVEANREADRLFGYAPGSLLQKPIKVLAPEREHPELRALLRSLRARPRSVTIGSFTDVSGMRADGTEFMIEIVVGPIDAPDGTFFTSTLRDVTERRHLESRLAHEASHDPLTGLPNRVLFVERLDSVLGAEGPVLARDDGAASKAAVLFLDVDHFKYVNDSRGHTSGDQLVQQVAERISASVRPEDVVARFGGDEFAILATGLRDERAAQELAAHILSSFELPFVVDGVELDITASVGIAMDRPGSDSTGLLRDADAAMYFAKQTGRARVALFDKRLTAKAEERLDLESALHKALSGNHLHLVYQPIVSLESGELVSMEALLRWERPDHGPVPPLSFIPVAEETGVILDIGRFVLAGATRQLAAWREGRSGLPPISVSVNVSSRQLEHDMLIGEVATVLEQTGLPPELLVLEITESIFIRDILAAVRRLESLKRLGVRIALDDFGTGFSSLNSLSRLPIDVVKIDKSFVDNLGSRYDAVVTSVVNVAQAFSLDVVAEGVESAAQASHLARLGCGYAQGYHFARPMPPDRIEEILLSRI